MLKQMINTDKLQATIYTSEKRLLIDATEQSTIFKNEWAPAVYTNNPSLFEKRLEAEGYNKEEFLKIANVESHDKFKHYMTKKLNLNMIDEGMKLYSELQQNLEKPTLVEFIYPFVLYAIKQVEEDIQVEQTLDRYDWNNIKQTLADAIATELVGLISKTVTLELQIEKLRENLEGETPEERFESFIIKRSRDLEHLYEFYEEYPVLTRTCLERTELFINNISTLFKRLNESWMDLNQKFNLMGAKLLDIKIGLGDTHQKGQTVAKLEYSNEKSIMYKPKSLDIVEKYNELIRWINKHNITISLPTYKVLDREEYGFEECIIQKECNSEEEVRRYYNRFGQLVGLMHMISGADMHYENIIANGEYPYLIDLETIFHQYPELDFPDTAEIKLKYVQSESVIGTGLLPQSLFQNADGKGVDLSALNGKVQKLPFSVLQIEQANTDEMVYKMQEAFCQGAENIPYLNGQRVDAQTYLSQIIDGYEQMMQFILKFKKELIEGPIQNFANSKIRIILRATQHYSNFLMEATHPDYSGKAVALEQMFERMWLYPFKDSRVISHELKDLLQRDVPYFYTTVDSKNLYTSHHNSIPNYFKKTGLEIVTEKISNLSEKEIQNQKRWLILAIGMDAQEVKTSEGNSIQSSAQNPSLKDFACQIGDYLIDDATWSEDKKTVSWLTIQNHENSWNVLPMSVNLYDGLGGIALFFSQLYKETKQEKYKVVAQAAIESTFETFKQPQGLISAFFGDCSLLYALHKMKEIDPNPKYEEKIKKIQTKLLEEVKNDAELDFLSGSAGIISLASTLYEETKEEIYKEIIQVYVQHLLSNSEIKDGKRVWINRHVNTRLGGLSHGTSGIGLALYAAGKALNDQSLIEFSHEALEYEKELFVQGKGWKDLRTKTLQYKHAWTHGTTGIGIAHVLNDNKKYTDVIQNAFTVLEAQAKKQNNSLKDGNLGDSELYLLAGQKLEDDQLKDKALSLVNESLNNIFEKSSYGVENVFDFEAKGLFNGVAGIGYQLLRMNNPDEVPSILTLGLAEALD
ncbi:type 2 lantipeptide synthetase LanM family protein [Lysinibacillus xylanilyticus]|uniref:type 2 lanthipeptide synthetase LanM family protein n=1 Tax=Lysinibacillus xylanilyticus TaxID=582475 RepID=UPI002B25224E|nr:type 2 lanthipeptide synthetase LanM family protein [Lysinibacillus xylanilyticus]MEB2300806.1 type 2 lantipeptide synthetase LanM family protein [Lysinibacillus xylanilyticus]